MTLRTTGMEFASEMVVEASLFGMSVCEVPTTLSPDGRAGRSHLRTWHDGFRGLRSLLLYSPRWLFLYPGLCLLLLALRPQRGFCRAHGGSATVFWISPHSYMQW